MKNNTKNNEEKKELKERIEKIVSLSKVAVMFTAIGYLSAVIDMRK